MMGKEEEEEEEEEVVVVVVVVVVLVAACWPADPAGRRTRPRAPVVRGQVPPYLSVLTGGKSLWDGRGRNTRVIHDP